MMIKPLNVLGLMGGTSFENIKCALISTDGIDIYRTFLRSSVPLPDFLRSKIKMISAQKNLEPFHNPLVEILDSEVTELMISLIEELRKQTDLKIDLIGVEGPTIIHDAEKKLTFQLGNGRKIFNHFEIATVAHFHNADLLHGGQGRPLTASYYQACALHISKPALFINIGGITSLTYIDELGQMMAFDVGAGNAMLNDFMQKHAHVAMDYNGQTAALGQADIKVVEHLIRNEFFEKIPPKSLNRNAFMDKSEHLEGLSLKDGAATIVEFIAEAVLRAVVKFLPNKPLSTVFCGGGTQNPTLLRAIKQKLKKENIDVEALEISPDNAQAFAFLAARRLYGLPITFPSTTGVEEPLTGGKLYSKEFVS